MRADGLGLISSGDTQTPRGDGDECARHGPGRRAVPGELRGELVPDGEEREAALANLLANTQKHPWKEVLSRQSRKPLRVVRPVEGSNPSPSAL